jgi:ribonucleoside-diphosphate reductase alpha chain
MSDKALQRVTASVSDIGQTVPRRRALPARRHHVTQKVKVAGQRTLYISVHDDDRPAEIFLRLKGSDCSSELIGLYDVIARLMSIALQYGAPLEKVGDLLAGAKFAPCGPVVGHDRLKSCTSLPDLIGRHLLVEYCGRHELGHVPVTAKVGSHLQEAYPR